MLCWQQKVVLTPISMYVPGPPPPTHAKINRTIDNTNLSSKNIMRTTRNDGVKDWWFNRAKSFCHPVIVLMLTHVSAFPVAPFRQLIHMPIYIQDGLRTDHVVGEN